MFKCSTTARSIFPKKDRVIVIGDLHADYDMTITLFKKLKLIDNYLNWIAFPKNTFVVQLGDQVDGGGRGNIETSGEIQLLNFMEDINVKASLVGGAVLSLIGNHEVMNMIGDFRYASNNDVNDVGGINMRRKIFRPGGELFNKLSCTRNVVVKIGSWVFAHAGILPQHLEEYQGDTFFEKINTLMRLFLQGKKVLGDSDIQKYFLMKDGIIWDRDYGGESPSCNKWKDTSSKLGAKYMAIGHTVQPKINSKCDNSIWRVDVGMSKLFETYNSQVLEILDDGEALPKNKFEPIRIIK